MDGLKRLRLQAWPRGVKTGAKKLTRKQQIEKAEKAAKAAQAKGDETITTQDIGKDVKKTYKDGK